MEDQKHVELGEFEGDEKNAELNAFMTSADWEGFGISFADAESIKAYEMAVNGTPGPCGRLPLVVINSIRMAAGKTRLARMILQKSYGSARAFRCDKFRDLELWLPEAIGAGYLWIDDVRPELLGTTELLQFSTCRSWTYRQLYSRNLAEVEIPENFQIVITGLQLTLPAILANRSIVINLA